MHENNGKMYLMNGFNPITYIENELIYIFDLTTHEWQIINNISSSGCQRDMYYAAYYNENVWIAGGRDEYLSYNTIVYYNLSALPVEPKLLSKNWIFPEARSNHGMYLISTKIILFGGIGSHG